jgi:hypothetical protein
MLNESGGLNKLVSQWLTFSSCTQKARICNVKLPDDLQIRERIAATELLLHLVGKALEDAVLVRGSSIAALLIFDNLTANQPIAGDLC